MTVELTLALNEHQMLTGFSYHDGRVHGASLSSDTAELVILSTLGERTRVVLRGVSSYQQAGNFADSIVGYIFVHRMDPGVIASGDVVFKLESVMGADITVTCASVHAYDDSR